MGEISLLLDRSSAGSHFAQGELMSKLHSDGTVASLIERFKLDTYWPEPSAGNSWGVHSRAKPAMTPDPKGEWVRYAEAAAQLTTLQQRLRSVGLVHYHLGIEHSECQAALIAAQKQLTTLQAALIAEREKHDEEAYNDMRAAKEAAEAHLTTLQADIHTYRGALGYGVPGHHDGRLSDGTTPRCGMCDARSRA